MSIRALRLALRALVLSIGCACTAAHASGYQRPSPPALFKTLGITVDHAAAGPSGMTVWTVERNGAQAVFYSTPDGKTVISGVLFDASTARNLSDQFIPDSLGASSTPSGTSAADDVPGPVRNVSTFVGFKEGSAPIDKTVYIIFDPRCPVCHQTYEATRDLVHQGKLSIKWIPIVDKGSVQEQAQSARWLSEAFREPNQALALQKLFHGEYPGKAVPSTALVHDLMANEEFLFASYHGNPSAGEPSIPTAYFATKDNKADMQKVGTPQLLDIVVATVKQ